MPDLIKYELPSVVVEPSHTYVGDVRRIFARSVTVATFPVSPGGLVCPVGLEVDPDVAPHLVVEDVKVGKNSQFCSIGCIPASLFATSPPVGCIPASLFATSPPVELAMDRISPGLNLSLSLDCVGPATVTFRGRLLARPPSTPRAGRSHVVGLGYTEVAAGATCDVVAFPMVELRLRRLHVPPHLLDAFRVDALFQGRYLDVERLSQVDPAQLGRDNLLRGGEVDLKPLDKVGINCPVTVRVTNTSGETLHFSGALLGDPARMNPR